MGTDSEKEKIAEKVLTKNEKPKLVLVEYYVFDGQFACYTNSREKGEREEKGERKKLLILDILHQKHPIFREQNQLLFFFIKIRSRKQKIKGSMPCNSKF